MDKDNSNQPDQFHQSLKDLKGIDIRSGLEQLEGDTEFYLSTLKSFLNYYENTPTKARQLSEKEQWDELQRLAHSMKSACGYIGAKALNKSAAALEDVLINKNNSSLLLESFTNELQIVIDSLKNNFSNDRQIEESEVA